MQTRAPITLAVAYPSAQLRPITGAVELAVGEAMARPLSRPKVVTAVLDAVFAKVGGQPVSADILGGLATGARAWLLMRAAQVFHGNGGWFTAQCPACSAPFDLQIDLAALPRSDASAAFPVITADTSLGPRQFEIPNGRTETALYHRAAEGVRAIAALCGLSQNAETDAKAFTRDDLNKIETSLDKATPDVADEIDTICPACTAKTKAQIDPLTFAFPKLDALDRDIHLIARDYGWDEPTILQMPTGRRRRHANMIAASQKQRALT
jgi:hypothetical protein